MKTIITADIHLTDESVITSMHMESGGMVWESLNLDDAATVYVNTREQAERLFDEVAELTMRWRERDPDHFRVEAEVAPKACAECGLLLTVSGELYDVGQFPEPAHVFCDICGQAEHPADLTTDWNGDTGCHISCEATSR